MKNKRILKLTIAIIIYLFLFIIYESTAFRVERHVRIRSNIDSIFVAFQQAKDSARNNTIRPPFCRDTVTVVDRTDPNDS